MANPASWASWAGGRAEAWPGLLYAEAGVAEALLPQPTQRFIVYVYAKAFLYLRMLRTYVYIYLLLLETLIRDGLRIA